MGPGSPVRPLPSHPDGVVRWEPRQGAPCSPLRTALHALLNPSHSPAEEDPAKQERDLLLPQGEMLEPCSDRLHPPPRRPSSSAVRLTPCSPLPGRASTWHLDVGTRLHGPPKRHCATGPGANPHTLRRGREGLWMSDGPGLGMNH